MKDRQFMIVLALVVAAGLVMGLVASRVTRGSASAPAVATGNAAQPARGGSSTDSLPADGDGASADSTQSPDPSQPRMKDGDSPDIATPEPAPPPPPEAPPATVVTDAAG